MNKSRIATMACGALVVTAISVVASGGSSTHGRPAGVPPEVSRPVTAPPVDTPPEVSAPPLSVPPVDVPTPDPTAAAGPPSDIPHPPFDVQDLMALLDAWGPCSEGLSCEWDLTGDGSVNWRDLVELVTNLD